MTKQEETFNADAAVVWRLGAELFTNPAQALLELVKNCYDADATEVRVEIKAPTSNNTGEISIQDNGHGMSRDDIVRGWLTLSSSAKADVKAEGLTTSLKRVPLGDKGLGRLGAQLLGQTLFMRTRPGYDDDVSDSTTELEVLIDFDEFKSGRLLTDIAPGFEIFEGPDIPDDWPGSKPWGTLLEISDLRGDPGWLDPRELEQTLSVLVNPYKAIKDFSLSVSVDGDELDLRGISSQVRKAALSTWRLKYEGGTLRLSGRIRAEALSLRNKEISELVQKALRRSRGRKEFISALSDSGRMVHYALTADEGPFAVEVQYEEIVEVKEDPGPFTMELDVVALDLSLASELGLGVFSKQNEYRKWIRGQAKVGIYRDGFVVAPNAEDILELGKEFSSGSSYYGLRPQNVLGYVAISAGDNAQLEETTSREGFRASPAFHTFTSLLRTARGQINTVLDQAGRTAVKMGRELSDSRDGIAGQSVEETVKGAQDLKLEGKAIALEISTASKEIGRVYRDQAFEPEVDTAIQRTLETLAKASRFTADVQQLAPIAEHLQRRIEVLEEARNEIVASAALGLVAEGIAHDLSAIVDRLRNRAKATNKVDSLPLEARLLVEDVDWAATALRSQLRHLDPMLRARLRREEVDLAKIVRRLASFHRDRLKDSGIRIRFSSSDSQTVRVSPGRLGQIIGISPF